ncbi:MAG: hypothetical protein PHT78_11045 [Desulfitobacteriaceae bacterium]|nr:hypothetical protein [Desulfitobacteriaceae bacterium]MDD4753760.1 hypothetical protein [Desulfitobacteriaceae bacterium]
MVVNTKWDSVEKSKQYQINILKERYNQVCDDLLKERRYLNQTDNPSEKKKHQ